MKELSIEQKAKRYDEAFERVKELLSRCRDNRDRRNMVYRVNDIESIFPELKENEDERVRKAIISGMKALQEKGKYTEFAHIPMDEVFTWLEKQGKKKSIDYTRTNVFIKKAYIWFNNNFMVHDEYGVMSYSFDTKEEMFENFKNYMKGE